MCIFWIEKCGHFFQTTFFKFDNVKPSLGSCELPQQIYFDPISSAVLTFIGYRQTSKLHIAHCTHLIRNYTWRLVFHICRILPPFPQAQWIEIYSLVLKPSPFLYFILWKTYQIFSWQLYDIKETKTKKNGSL